MGLIKECFYLSAFAIVMVVGISCQEHVSADLAGKKSKHHPRLFLLSKGLVNDTLKATLLDLVNVDPSQQKVAIIVNATKSEEKKIKKTRKARERFVSVGFDSLKVEMFDVLKRANKDLLEFDIIYILGGNPFALLSEIRSTNTDSILVALASSDRIIMGYSAGALLLGPHLQLMNSVDSVLGFNESKLEELACLELYDFLVFPHFQDFTGQVPELANLISDYEQSTNFEIVRLNDDQGIVIERGRRRIVGL